MYSYNVRCTISDAGVAARWLAWILDPHIDDVVAAGALGAEVVQLVEGVPEGTTYEVRYRFQSEAAHRRYLAEQAPHLKAEGLALFPLELGLVYSRTWGPVVGGE